MIVIFLIVIKTNGLHQIPGQFFFHNHRIFPKDGLIQSREIRLFNSFLKPVHYRISVNQLYFCIWNRQFQVNSFTVKPFTLFFQVSCKKQKIPQIFF